MPAWRQRGELWTVGHAEPKGVVQFLGGSGLGASPQLSYKRLLEAISRRGWLVQCWSYLPSFDHQLLAVQAWQSFRAQRHSGLPVLRLGHSMGCKLHLLAHGLQLTQQRTALIKLVLSKANQQALPPVLLAAD